MGLLDKLLKQGAEVIKEVATEENKEKAAEFLKAFKDNLTELTESVRESVNTETKQSDPSIYEEVDDGKTCRERILEILATEFPEYEVEEDVSPTVFGAQGRFMNYSMVVFKDGVPALFIMLIGKTTTAHREYRWSRAFAEDNGYRFINFVNHFPNNPAYITERLHKYL